MSNMEVTYTMIGTDGLQYGPINLEQIRTWASEGRIAGDTKVLRSDTNAWLPASQYSELGLVAASQSQGPAVAVATPPSRPMTAKPSVVDPVLVRRARGAGGWFFAIAIFSVINAILAMSQQGAFFLVGLGVNLLFHNIVIQIAISGIFALFGFFARKGQMWSFIVGMIFYGLDALIFLPAALWLPFAFHVYALFRIFMGLLALNQLKAQGR